MDRYDKELESLRKKAVRAIDKAVDALAEAKRAAGDWQEFASGQRKGEALSVTGMLTSASTKAGQAAVRAKGAR